MPSQSAARENETAEDAGGRDQFGIYFPLLFEQYPVPLFVYDWDDGTIVLVNTAALAQYGYGRRAFRGLRVSDLMAAKDAAQVAEDRASVTLKASRRLHRRADGTTFPVDIVRHRLTVGNRTLALVMCPDASERVRDEEELRHTTDALRRSRDALVRAQRIARTGSVERDFHTKKTTWSEETYRIFGVTPETFTPNPQSMLALVHPDDRARVADALRNTAAGAPAQLQYRIIRPDGEERVVYREAEVVCDETGATVRSVSTIRDVTRAHQAQERQTQLEADLRAAKDEAEALTRAMQEANIDLELRVEDRTNQLRATQAELIKKERLSTLGQLTATVAHELRNPLSAIKNTIYAIGEIATAKGVGVERPLERINRSIDRCNRIIGDLLDYSRTRALDLTARNLDDWLRETIDEQAIPAGVTLAFDLDAGAAQARFDAERLRQVVVNLLENAVQALAEAPSASAAPRVVVRTRLNEDHVEIAFDDNGPGIAPEHLARVFEPLFSTKSFGTGLGLATVKHIVEQHGGAIDIASTPGRGTVVALRLPLNRERQAA